MAEALSGPLFGKSATPKNAPLYRRAGVWSRRYDDKVRVVILVGYLWQNPCINNAAVLVLAFARRNRLGLCPFSTAVPLIYDTPTDAVP